MRLRRVAWALTLVLSLAGPSASAEEPPEYAIKGATLELGNPRATIQAPSTYWKWSKAQDSKEFRAYRCTNVIDERNFYVLLVSTAPTKPLEGETDDILTGIKKALPPNFVVAAPRLEPSDVPWPGSYRIQYALGSASGSAYIYAYAAHRSHVFVTLAAGLSPTEPADFVAFTRSLSVTERKGVRKGVVPGLIGIVAIIGIIQWIRSRSASD